MNAAACRLTAVFLILSASLTAGEAPSLGERARQVLNARCASCHGPDKQEGSLRLDSLSAATTGGDRGPAITPGGAAASWLVKSIGFSDPDLQMPPKQKLSDAEIAILTEWINAGAKWPVEALVLFDDDPLFATALTEGDGSASIVDDQPYSGRLALRVTPLQRHSPRLPNWSFAVRETPGPGEFRFLRLAWKKQGPGSVLVELARNGEWPQPNEPRGRYFAGTNGTGWVALSVAEQVPSEWTAVTFDLWADLGDCVLTGIAPTCDGGEAAYFDAIVLGPTRESVESYQFKPQVESVAGPPIGDAFTDERNPIRRLFHGERLDLWSLQPPRRSDPPGAGHPIDAFINARLAAEQLAPAPLADRRTLIRRATFDLIGLPPTSEEVAAFEADDSADAYEKLVDRLLASPRYGERQARLWLDVVRYADTNGYERDEFRPLAWKYRDYVVRSFNADKPFDQFTREQLAGDELTTAPPQSERDADALIATGYLRLGQWDSTASIFQEEERLASEVAADLTNTTASAFLGLTMSCCQCHDHKYDPLSHADHYRFRAFFAGTEPTDVVVSLADDATAIDAHNAEIDRQQAPLNDERKELGDKDPDRRKKLDEAIAQIESQRRQPDEAMGVRETSAAPPATHLLVGGDHLSPRETVSAGFPSVWSPGAAAVVAPRSDTSGRRLALANWIVAPQNPWTARVFVNRLWQQHFGAGLVATPNDFGYTGARPTHPELLDWLALEFIERGWSVKQMHRLIVTSQAYQRTSAETEAGRRADPENRLYRRQTVQRLDAETIRDALLATSGLLRSYDAGKPLWPPVPEELRKAQPAILEAEKGDDGGRMQGWYADPVEQTDVRSLFLIRKRCLPVPFLQAFDLPDSTTSCARRDSTVVAPQALMLLNSPEVVRYAQALATKISGTHSSDATSAVDDPQRLAAHVASLFRVALNRRPTERESRLAAEFLTTAMQRREQQGEDALHGALTELCRAVFNLNEFIYID